MSTSPVFNEVIGVSFDTQSFQDSIEQLQRLWKDALDEMSGTAPSITVTDTSGLADSLGKLAAQFSDAVDAMFSKLDNAVTARSASISASAKQAATDVVNEFADAANQGEEALERFYGAASKFLKSSGNPRSLTTNAQSRLYQGLEAGEGGDNALGIDFDQMSAKQRQWFVDYSQTLAQAEDRMREFETSAADEDQRRIQQQIAMQDRASAEMLADFKRGIEQKIAAQEEDLGAVSRFTAEEQEIYQRAAMKYAATWDSAYAEKARREEEQQRNQPQGFAASFTGAFSEQFSAESLGSLAGLQLAWAGIGAAMSAASEAAEKIADLFKSGFEYSEQLEQSAARLQGVIASNVTLSSNFEENYKLAGEAAQQLQRNFEDASVQYGVSVDVLERGFKQFIDGGGTSLVRNLNEAQQAAIQFAVALQAAGKDADSSRAIIGELPKLLSGTEKPSSLILETLGLTNKQWDALVAHAREHHDLLDQLTPLLQNYTHVAEDAANRQEALYQSIGLQVKRIMADAEQPIFAAWTDELKSVSGFLQQNSGEIELFMRSVFDAADAVGKLVAEVLLLNNNGDVAEGGFKSLVSDVALFANGLTTATGLLSTLISMMSHFGAMPFGDAIKAAKKDWEDFNADLNKRATRFLLTDQLGLNAKQAAQVMGEDSVLDQTATGKPTIDQSKPKYNDDALNQLKKRYQQEADASKGQYQTELDQNKLLLAERKKSVQEVDAANAQAAQSEYTRQMRLIEQTQQAIASLHSANPKNVTSFGESLDTKSTQLSSAESHRVAEQHIKDVQASLAAEDRANEQSIAAVRKMTDDKIAEYRRGAQSGQQITSASLAVEAAYYRAAQNTLDGLYSEEIARAGANADRVSELNAKKAESDAAYTAKLKELSDQRTEVQLQEFTSQQNAALSQAKTRMDQAIAENQRHGGHNDALNSDRSVKAAQAELAYASAVLKARDAELAKAQALGITGNLLDKNREQVQAATQAQIEAQRQLAQAQQQKIDSSPVGAAVTNTANDLSDALKGNGDFSSTVNNFGEAINTFHTSVNNIVEAIDKGGILGGAGASASAAGGAISSISQGLGKELGSAFQSFAAVGGPLLSGLGTLFTAVSSIFEQEAQDIANTIEQNLQNINNSYSDQTATLVQTLAAVQEQRQQAISELSGIKGGQDQLDKLLPQIDQEIASLQLQIQEAMVTFTNELQDIDLNNTALTSAFDKWQQINQQAQAYLSAGGSVAAANQYISQSLEQMKQAAGDALNQGYQSAVQDALTLNNLIQQRMQMEQQEAETEFNTVNSDALERRLSTKERSYSKRRRSTTSNLRT